MEHSLGAVLHAQNGRKSDFESLYSQFQVPTELRLPPQGMLQHLNYEPGGKNDHPSDFCDSNKGLQQQQQHQTDTHLHQLEHTSNAGLRRASHKQGTPSPADVESISNVRQDVSTLSAWTTHEELGNHPSQLSEFPQPVLGACEEEQSSSLDQLNSEYCGAGVAAMINTLKAAPVLVTPMDIWLQFPRVKFTRGDLNALRATLIDVRSKSPRSTRFVMEDIRAAMATVMGAAGLSSTLTLQVHDLLRTMPSFIRNQKHAMKSTRKPRPPVTHTPTPRVIPAHSNRWPLDELRTLDLCKLVCGRAHPIRVIVPKEDGSGSPRFPALTMYRLSNSRDWFVRASVASSRPIAGPVDFYTGIEALTRGYFDRSLMYSDSYAPLLNILQIVIFGDYRLYDFPPLPRHIDLANSLGLCIDPSKLVVQ